MRIAGRGLVVICCWLWWLGAAQAESMQLADHPLVNKIWDMQQQVYLDDKVLLHRIKQADIVLIGETHDNRLHHQRQQQLLQHLLDAGHRPALVMEQIDMTQQTRIDALQADDADKAEQLSALVNFGNRQDYRGLLESALEYALPVVAANISRQALRPVIRNGLVEYDTQRIQQLGLEAVWNDSRQRYLYDHMKGVHCGMLRDELRVTLSQAQRLRDAVMVDNTLPYLQQGVVVITGRDHARNDIGMPLYFALKAADKRRLAIGLVEVSAGKDDPAFYQSMSATEQAPYDVIWFTPRMPREDPCAGFDKHQMATKPAKGE